MWLWLTPVAMWIPKCCQFLLNNRKALQGNGLDSRFQPVDWKCSVRVHLLDMLIPYGCGIPAKTQAEWLQYEKVEPTQHMLLFCMCNFLTASLACFRAFFKQAFHSHASA